MMVRQMKIIYYLHSLDGSALVAAEMDRPPAALLRLAAVLARQAARAWLRADGAHSEGSDAETEPPACLPGSGP
jgi:hypothetical protein